MPCGSGRSSCPNGSNRNSRGWWRSRRMGRTGSTKSSLHGYRMHARLDRGAVRLLTRTGLAWTHKYPAIASAVSALPTKQAYLDGELCGVRPDGTTSFSIIQAASDTGNADALVFFFFDLLYIGGEDLQSAPLHDRK